MLESFEIEWFRVHSMAKLVCIFSVETCDKMLMEFSIWNQLLYIGFWSMIKFNYQMHFENNTWNDWIEPLHRLAAQKLNQQFFSKRPLEWINKWINIYDHLYMQGNQIVVSMRNKRTNYFTFAFDKIKIVSFFPSYHSGD